VSVYTGVVMPSIAPTITAKTQSQAKPATM